MKTTAWKLYNIYLAIVSFVAIVAISINFWIVLTSVGQYFLITDDEYLQNREYYKIEQCETWADLVSRWIIDSTNSIQRTPEEISKCIEKVKLSVSASRSYNLKEMFIGSWAWFIVFLAIFLFHYPKFIKEKNRND